MLTIEADSTSSHIHSRTVAVPLVTISGGLAGSSKDWLELARES